MAIQNEDWLTVQEAAKLSGYHPEYIRRLIRDNAIKAQKISIVWLVDRKSLQNYVDKASSSEDGRYNPKRNKQ